MLNGKGTCGISTQLLYKPKITKSLTLLVGTSANLMFVSQVIAVGHHWRESGKTSFYITIEFWQMITSFPVLSLDSCIPTWCSLTRGWVSSFLRKLSLILLYLASFDILLSCWLLMWRKSIWRRHKRKGSNEIRIVKDLNIILFTKGGGRR